MSITLILLLIIHYAVSISGIVTHYTTMTEKDPTPIIKSKTVAWLFILPYGIYPLGLYYTVLGLKRLYNDFTKLPQ